MLEQFEHGTSPYYAAMQKLTAEELKLEWKETTKKEYWYMLEVLPPAAMAGSAFMVGECLAYSGAGNLYQAYTRIGKRYFTRPAPLRDFNPEEYSSEIKTIFKDL